ncbi:MAG TPA: tyrosine-type recombinase/integrase [Candidatus Limnocylindrales bacterium]|nr:tyrosine-type recombinase/integrase [Candidatus Limnocylindrales bacterium]
MEHADSYLADSIRRAEGSGSGWATDTTGHHVAQLRAFAGHAAAIAGLPANPLAGFKGPKRTRREDRTVDGLEDDEVIAVLDSLGGSTFRDVVDRGLFVLGFEDGPRRSEFAPMDVADFRLAERAGQPLGWVVDVRYPAKGGKPRTLPLGVRAEGALRDLVGRRASGPLFPSRDGTALSGERIGERLAALGDRAGVDLSPQRLRRSASSWQDAYGASSGHLDTVFGWQPNPIDVKSGHYIKPTLTQLLIAHQTQLSPLDRLEHRVGRLPLG